MNPETAKESTLDSNILSYAKHLLFKLWNKARFCVFLNIDCLIGTKRPASQPQLNALTERKMTRWNLPFLTVTLTLDDPHFQEKNGNRVERKMELVRRFDCSYGPQRSSCTFGVEISLDYIRLNIL